MAERHEVTDMGIRETVNKRQRVTGGVAVGMLVVAAVLVVLGLRKPAARVTRAYYCDESGANMFVDDVDRVYPFDHNGKAAYRAYVYEGQDGKNFVAYIARYTDAAKQKLQSLIERKDDPSVSGELAQARGSGIEVKKPGDPQWVPLFSSQGAVIASHPILADGSTAHMVNP